MLNHKGVRRIETERIILRKFRKEDSYDMYNNWASDDEVTKYLSWPTHSSVELSKNVISLWINNQSKEDFYNWAIVWKKTNEVIGSIGLVNVDNINESCEVGYCISKKFWGQGVTSEAFLALIKFAFDEVGFERITGRHHVENTASGKVMEKCGLQYEGTLRKVIKNNCGALVDCKYYSILKEEFKGFEH